jgi:hypothetical protein
MIRRAVGFTDTGTVETLVAVCSGGALCFAGSPEARMVAAFIPEEIDKPHLLQNFAGLVSS